MCLCVYVCACVCTHTLSIGHQHRDSLMCLGPDPGYTACFLPPPFLSARSPLSLSPSSLPSPVPHPTHTVCNAAIEYPATRCVCNKLSSPKRRMRMQGLSVRHSLLCLYSVCCVSSRHPRRGACAIHPQVLHSNKLPRPKVQLLSRDTYMYICVTPKASPAMPAGV